MGLPIQYTRQEESCTASFNAVLDVQFDETGSEEPCTTAELKAFAKIDTTAEDALIAELGKTARQMCEAYTNISFVQREVTAVLNNSCGGSYLPYGPIPGDVTSIKDEDGNDYTDAVIKGNDFKFIKQPVSDHIEVVYDAGYEKLPKTLKTAVLNQFTYLYDNRGNETEASMSPIAKLILKPFRRV